MPLTRLRRSLLPALLLGCSCEDGGSSRPPDGGPFDSRPSDAALPDAPLEWCVKGWPAAGVTGVVPSLPTTPSVLWTRTYGWLGLGRELALLPEGPVVTAGNRVWFLSTTGDVRATFDSMLGEPLSPPVIDGDENVLVSGSRLYALDGSGQLRWSYPFRATLVLDQTGATGATVSPDGIAVVAATDGYVYAVRSNGSLAWEKFVGVFGYQPAGVGPGVGDTVFIGEASGTSVYGVLAGDFRGTMVTPDGLSPSPQLFTYDRRILTMRSIDGNVAIHALDPCGHVLWTLPPDAPKSPGLVLPGASEHILVAARTAAGITFTAHDTQGRVVLGPTAGANVLVVGSDGAVYGVTCDEASGRTTLRRFGDSFAVDWSLDLGGIVCPPSGWALGADGVLYLSRLAADGTFEIVAVQTESQGPAQSAWPMSWRRNNRGTRWLVPN